MRRIVGIDPGNTHSGLIVWDTGNERVLRADKEDNAQLLVQLRNGELAGEVVAIEVPDLIGQSIWHQVLETCQWLGRFREAAEARGMLVELITRRQVKLTLLGRSSVKGADAHIRQALIQRYGPPGTKKEPGRTYGVSRDAWAALAVVTAYLEGGNVPF